VELTRRLYPRGGSYETTIPKPLLFACDLTRRQLVRFIYDEERRRWYLDFAEDPRDDSDRDDTKSAKKRNRAEQRGKLVGPERNQGGGA